MWQPSRMGPVSAMLSRLGRRRTLTLLAATAAAPLALGLLPGRAAQAHHWQGTAFGTRASLTLYHPEAATARRLVAECVTLLREMEATFSLYRADSALARLNRTGVLEEAPPALLTLLGHARALAARTGGAFDPTVQPLWHLYFTHFAAAGADSAGPSAAAVRAAAARVDWRRLHLDPAKRRVWFDGPDMAVTLNGIAQGHAGDILAAHLRDAGLAHVLVDVGEPRAVGAHPEGRPWRVGIADPARPDTPLFGLDLPADHAVATSGGYGTVLDGQGRFHHLFDPRSGDVVRDGPASVSVVARDGTTADALSTALGATPLAQGPALMAGLPASVTAHVVAADGRRHRWQGGDAA